MNTKKSLLIVLALLFLSIGVILLYPESDPLEKFYIGEVFEVKKGEIVIAAEDAAKLNPGTKLKVKAGEKFVVVTVYKNYFTQVLAKGMGFKKGQKVYSMDAPEPVVKKTPEKKEDEKAPVKTDKIKSQKFGGIEFVGIKGGCFMMGSHDSDPDSQSWEKPQHEVCVDSFLMAKYETTQKQHDPEHRKKMTRLNWGNGPAWTKGEPSYAERRPAAPKESSPHHR